VSQSDSGDDTTPTTESIFRCRICDYNLLLKNMHMSLISISGVAELSIFVLMLHLTERSGSQRLPGNSRGGQADGRGKTSLLV
jgi:hypothetical protein